MRSNWVYIWQNYFPIWNRLQTHSVCFGEFPLRFSREFSRVGQIFCLFFSESDKHRNNLAMIHYLIKLILIWCTCDLFNEWTTDCLTSSVEVPSPHLHIASESVLLQWSSDSSLHATVAVENRDKENVFLIIIIFI
jgi:hypothetical protein